MRVFLMPAEVRRYFMLPLSVTAIRADGLRCPLEYMTDAGRSDVRNCLWRALYDTMRRHPALPAWVPGATGYRGDGPAGRLPASSEDVGAFEYGRRRRLTLMG